MKIKLIVIAITASITLSACDFIPSCLTKEGKDNRWICLNKNPEYEDESVVKFCAASNGETITVSYEGVTKTVTKHVVDLKTLQGLCPETYAGCVFMPRNDVYISDKVRCESIASHELAHVFGVDWVDKPKLRQIK